MAWFAPVQAAEGKANGGGNRLRPEREFAVARATRLEDAAITHRIGSQFPIQPQQENGGAARSGPLHGRKSINDGVQIRTNSKFAQCGRAQFFRNIEFQTVWRYVHVFQIDPHPSIRQILPTGVN